MSRIRLPSERRYYDASESESSRRIRVEPFVARTLYGRLLVGPVEPETVFEHPDLVITNEVVDGVEQDPELTSSQNELLEPSTQLDTHELGVVGSNSSSNTGNPIMAIDALTVTEYRVNGIANDSGSEIEVSELTDVNESPDESHDYSALETFYDASEHLLGTEPSPEYNVTLDRRIDVLLFDPRILPLLRVNKLLLDTCVPEILSEVVSELLVRLPEDVDPLTLPQLQDKDYFKHIPELLMRQQLVEARRYEQQMERQQRQRRASVLRSLRLFDDVQSDLAYALMLSLKELVATERTYHGFRYRRPQVS